MNHCVESLPYSASMLENKLQTAKKGIQFERHLDMALGLQSQKRWDRAKVEFQKAAELFEDGFDPTLEEINEAILACENRQQIRAHHESDEMLLEADAARSDYAKVIFPLMLAVLGFIFLFFFTSSPDPEKSLAESLADMDLPSSPPKTEVENIPNPVVETEDEINLTDSLILTEEELEETEESLTDIDYTLAQLPQIAETNTLMLEAEMADIEEIDRPVEIVESLEDEDMDDETEDNHVQSSASEETSSGTPNEINTTNNTNRIAVVPFCSNGDDQTVAKKLFLDASFELRNAIPASMSPISRNAVKKGMTKLGISDDLTCSKLHTIRIAREIQAGQIIMGNVEQLEDERIQLTLRILNPVDRSFVSETTMSADNMQKLREKTKT